MSEQIEQKNREESLTEEEFEKRLEIANIFINSYFYVYYDDSDSTYIYNKINSLLDDEASRIFVGISGIEQDLEYKKLWMIEEVLRIIFGKRLYSEMSLDAEVCDDCIILGFVKLDSGYAVLYTYSLPKNPKTNIEFEIIKQD
jgi:hypothetical protein